MDATLMEEQILLCSVRKVAEQPTMCQPVSIISLCSVLQFLPLGHILHLVSAIASTMSSSTCFCSMFYHSNTKKTGTEVYSRVALLL